MLPPKFHLDATCLRAGTEDNAYANVWGDKQRALWYVMVFSVVVNCRTEK